MNDQNAPTKKRRLLWLLPAILLLSQSGCLAVAAGTAAGVAATAYYKGNKKEVFSADFDTVYDSTLESLYDLDLIVKKQSRGRGKGTIEALTRTDESVTIELEYEPGKLRADPSYTRVKIRVGTWGDEAASGRIFDHIDARVQYYQSVAVRQP